MKNYMCAHCKHCNEIKYDGFFCDETGYIESKTFDKGCDKFESDSVELCFGNEMTVRQFDREAQQKKEFNSVKDGKIVLRKCPFCGSGNVKINYPYSGSSVSCVQCYSCGCTTALFDAEDKSIEAWNMRCDDESNQK